MLHVWQLRPARSLRLHARRKLNAMRRLRRLAWTRERVRRLVVNAEFTLVVPLAIFVHLPMVMYFGRRPGAWLDGAWQVSGVMVGLVVTLIIFLLQSAATQSLRSDATFRAILRRTGVLWPVSWALVFIAAVASVERFAEKSPNAASFIDTYTLVLFVVQVSLFGVAFLRAIRIVSPQGVAGELAKQFRDGLVLAVEAEFGQQLAASRMLAECQAQNVTFGSFLASGWPVAPKRDGWVIDADVALARNLNKLQLGAGTTITAQPGEWVDSTSPLAVTHNKPGAILHETVRAAFRVRRRGRPPQAPIDVFNDAVDLARRALIDGSNVSQDLAVQLIADCYTAFHDAYALYGVTY
jgi:hypothetical protein